MHLQRHVIAREGQQRRIRFKWRREDEHNLKYYRAKKK